MLYAWEVIAYDELDQTGVYLWSEPWRDGESNWSVVYHEFERSWEAAVVNLDDSFVDDEHREMEDLPFNWVFG
jgi:hypothetical protein